MAVIKTQPWLYQFVEACKKKSLSELYFNQCETICHPVKKTFTKITPEELHYLLLKYGMFEPDEWKEIPKTVRKMEERHT
ncbi:hypothetical protein [Salibacterium salarium]|uniref:hypothetical protein n=1 Tax=Salibacterium salarium TaxID=284579 RepID=UPI001FEA7A5E|nr:hypothetical protein [Salibacterium salarium]